MSIQAKKKYDAKIKLLLLGEAKVGKTNILARFCGEKFSEKYLLTIGVDFKERVVRSGNMDLCLSVWDTAGQERFRALSPTYYRFSMGVLFVYSIDDRSSFNKIIEWVNSHAEHAEGDVPKILIGNKSDLDATRQVPTAAGEQFAQQNNMLFIETSAKTGSCIDQAFLMLTDRVREARFANWVADTSGGPPSSSDDKPGSEGGNIRLHSTRGDTRKKKCC